MIKLIIFDLDGVLVDARDLHYHALNRALESINPKFVINIDEHLSLFDGLPTKRKLKLLTEKKGLSEDLYQEVWEKKQNATIKLINSTFQKDHRLCKILKYLKDQGLTVCVASNSIRESVKSMLYKSGMIPYIDFWLSNQDVNNPKPNVEMYLKCMIKAGVSPKETIIVEDSHIGRKAALDSGAFLYAVKNPNDVHLNKIMKIVNKYKDNENKPKWIDKIMNVVIPMAGAGSRFESAGYTFPKPLIDVNGKPMIQTVVENLNIEANYIFIVQKEHYERYNLNHFLKLLAPNCTIIQVDGMTEGAACTALLAKKFIDNDQPLLISNSDQYVEWDSNQFMYSMSTDNIDGGILTFKATHPKWSFVELDNSGFVKRVAEKDPISDNATVGIYYYSKGSEFVKYAEQMIEENDRVNNEFYICPIYNYFIKDGKKIKTYMIDQMWGLGTPEDLKRFLDHA